MKIRYSTFYGGNPFYDWLARKYKYRLLEGKSTIRDIPYCLKLRPQYGYTLIVFSLRAARGTSEKCLNDTVLYLELLAGMLKADGTVDADYIRRLENLAREYRAD